MAASSCSVKSTTFMPLADMQAKHSEVMNSRRGLSETAANDANACSVVAAVDSAAVAVDMVGV